MAGIQSLPAHLPQGHPRLMTPTGKGNWQQVEKEEWAKTWWKASKRIDPLWKTRNNLTGYSHCDVLKSKATQAYLNGSLSPCRWKALYLPSVSVVHGSKYTIKRPELEDIVLIWTIPKVCFSIIRQKKDLWSGRINECIGRCHPVSTKRSWLQDAAFIYWLTEEEKYARFAFDIFNTYMMDVLPRRTDRFGNGHAQTLGLSTFEVIWNAS